MFLCLHRRRYTDAMVKFSIEAQLFTQMGRSEELGTGLRNVFKYSKAYSGSDKVIFLEEDVFIVKVPLVSDVTDNVTKDVTKDVIKEGRAEVIIEMISKDPEITIKDMAELLNITSRTVLRELKQLMAQKRITRNSGRKSGSWQIVEDKKG